MGEEDPTDIFDTSLSSLFSIPPIAFSSSPGKYYAYIPPSSGQVQPKAIELALPQPPPHLYKTLQANNLWLSGIYLADLLSRGHIDVREKNVAELGAGAGLPGIVACRDGGAATVVSSDWGADEILTVLRDNFSRGCEDCRWTVVGHEWGTEISPLLRHLPKMRDRFDVLLLADVLWVTEAHQPLLESIGNLLRPEGVAHITAGLHTGRGPIERFIAKAEKKGWSIKPQGEVRWKIEGGWDEYNEAMRGGSDEEERGVVVWLTLHV